MNQVPTLHLYNSFIEAIGNAPFIPIILPLVFFVLQAHLGRQTVDPLVIGGLCVKGKVVPALECRVEKSLLVNMDLAIELKKLDRSGGNQ